MAESCPCGCGRDLEWAQIRMAAGAIGVLRMLPVADRLASVLNSRKSPHADGASHVANEGAMIAGTVLAAAHGTPIDGYHRQSSSLAAAQRWVRTTTGLSQQISSLDPAWAAWWTSRGSPAAVVRWRAPQWMIDVPAAGAPSVPETPAISRPSPEDVELLLASLGRLLDDAAATGEVDEALIDECQVELRRLSAVDALSDAQAEAAVGLLYRWNKETQAQRAGADPPGGRRPAGLYPDPTGEFRKRWWDGESWGAGVGRPRPDLQPG